MSRAPKITEIGDSNMIIYGGARLPGKSTARKMQEIAMAGEYETWVLTLHHVGEAGKIFFQTLNNPTQLREYIQSLDKMREVHFPSACRYGHSINYGHFREI